MTSPFLPKKLEKGDQMNPANLNLNSKIENKKKKQQRTINETRNLFFENISMTDRLLAN